jgi:lysozyme
MVMSKRVFIGLVLVFLVFRVRESEAIVVCPAGTTVQGVDVSRWQGSVDWGQVASSGVAFAFARVADGLEADPRFTGNYSGIEAAGMIRGAYQVLRPGEDPIEQADLFLSTIGPTAPGDLPPALHVELTDSQPPSVIRQAIEDWVSTIEQATGRAPLIFTNAFFWDGSVAGPASSPYPLWVAHWDVACPNTPASWLGWDFWQYTGSGSVPGIVGPVNRNVFDGPLEELQQLANLPRVPLMSSGARIGVALMLGWIARREIALRGLADEQFREREMRTS